MNSVNMHPIGLSCSEMFTTEVTINPRSFKMFALNMVDNVSGHIAGISTLCTLQASCWSFEIHRLNGSIKFLIGTQYNT